MAETPPPNTVTGSALAPPEGLGRGHQAVTMETHPLGEPKTEHSWGVGGSAVWCVQQVDGVMCV